MVSRKGFFKDIDKLMDKNKMGLQKKRINTLTGFGLILLFSYCVLLGVQKSFFNISYLLIEMLAWAVIMFTVGVVGYEFWEKRNITAFILYHLAIAFFVTNRIGFDIFYGREILGQILLLGQKLTVSDRIELLTFLLIAEIFLYLGYRLFAGNVRLKTMSHPVQKTDCNLLVYGLLVFCLSFPIYFYKAHLKFLAADAHGYLSIHLGGETAINYPVWTKGTGFIFEAAFCFILAARPPKKIFFPVALLFTVAKFYDSLRGQRILFAMAIGYVIWYYLNTYLKKLNLKHLVILGGAAVIIFTSFSVIRTHSLQQNSSFATVQSKISKGYKNLFSFIEGQSVSIYVFGHMIHFKEKFKNKRHPYIFDKVVNLFTPWTGQNEKTIQEHNALSDQLTYFLNRSVYLYGGGTGGSFLGELYDLGRLGFIIGAVTIGFCIYLFELFFQRNRWVSLIAYYVISQLLWMPRGEVLYSVRNILVTTIIYISFLGFQRITRKSFLNFEDKVSSLKRFLS